MFCRSSHTISIFEHMLLCIKGQRPNVYSFNGHTIWQLFKHAVVFQKQPQKIYKQMSGCVQIKLYPQKKIGGGKMWPGGLQFGDLCSIYTMIIKITCK